MLYTHSFNFLNTEAAIVFPLESTGTVGFIDGVVLCVFVRFIWNDYTAYRAESFDNLFSLKYILSC